MKYIEFVVDEKVKRKKFQKHILLDEQKEKALISAWNSIDISSWTGKDYIRNPNPKSLKYELMHDDRREMWYLHLSYDDKEVLAKGECAYPKKFDLFMETLHQIIGIPYSKIFDEQCIKSDIKNSIACPMDEYGELVQYCQGYRFNSEKWRYHEYKDKH